MRKPGSILALCGLLLAAGCSASGSEGVIESVESPAEEAMEPEAAADLPDIDPPLAFEEPHTVPYTELHQAHGGLVYGLDEDDIITSYALATGEKVSEALLEIDSEISAADELSEQATLLVPSGDGMLLVRMYVYVPPVTGSEAESIFMMVKAFRAEDGSVAWTRQLESWERGGGFLDVYETSEDHIILAWGSPDEPTRSHILDTATGESVWTSEEITAVAVRDGAVAAFDPGGDSDRDGEYPTAYLMDLDSGETTWSHDFESGISIDGYSLGGGFVKFTANGTSQYADDSSESVVVDTVAGSPVAEFKHPGDIPCEFDQVSVIVCDGQSTLFAIDAATGETLWDAESIGDGRELPDVVDVAHNGVLYMEYSNASRPPLALDARTGEDLATELPGVFIDVGPGYAITEAWNDNERVSVLEIHLATG